MSRRQCLIGIIIVVLAIPSVRAESPTYDVSLRTRRADDDGWIQIRQEPEKWNPARTAIIVCDMWDAHHCLNAVRRVKQLAPRIDQLLKHARQRGSTIIHAPSSCLDFYADHPARRNVAKIPPASNVPDDIGTWCHWKNDLEESIGYPIDASDGGEDDDLQEHQQWHAQLTALGRNPRSPWIRQTADIEIDADDYITDDGVENWNILEYHDIENVMIVGVHTNMCVLGRPFGLRQLSRNGKHVVLVRDLTDTMYNPAMPPYVNHFSGTDLIVEHIEQHVCPTIASNQILGGTPLRFRRDQRPHIVMLIGEQEYKTRVTLPNFAKQHLYRDHRVSYAFARPDDRNYFDNLDALQDADLMIVSVRRRSPPADQMNLIRDYIASGGPVIGIRTASHAFALRNNQSAPEGHETWASFDADVFGGNYTGHHGNKGDDDEKTYVWLTTQSNNPIGQNVPWQSEKNTTAWLYKTSPLKPGTHTLMMGRVGSRQPHEPVTWTFIHVGGGRSFYTSLGHPDDFEDAGFQELFKNAVAWALKVGPAS